MKNKTHAFDHGLYLDLDTLLDTRLATLHVFHPDIAIKACNSGYETREVDEFPHVSRELFKKLYAARGIDTLTESVHTNVWSFIQPIVLQMITETITTPYAKDAKVWLNIYPYRLSKEMIKDIGDELYKYLNEAVAIQIVFMPPEQVTPTWLKDNVSLAIKYEYEDWLEMHTDNFKVCQIPDIQLFIPKLFLKGKPSEEDLESLSGEHGDIFNLIEMSTSSIINIKFLDIEVFNAKIFKDMKYGVEYVKDE